MNNSKNLSDNTENTEFIVKDKRRFDSEGNEKGEETVLQEGKSTNVEQKVAEKELENLNHSHDAVHSHDSVDEQIDFSSFIVSLATQAMVQMGVMPPPPGMDLPKNKEVARQTIDIISMLNDKTKGNLDPSESRLMDDILHNLRMAYLQS